MPAETRIPSLNDRLEAEALDAAVTQMVPVLKSFMEGDPNRRISQLKKDHARKIAQAAIGGWIGERVAQARLFDIKGGSALDDYIRLQNDDLNDTLEDLIRPINPAAALLG